MCIESDFKRFSDLFFSMFPIDILKKKPVGQIVSNISWILKYTFELLFADLQSAVGYAEESKF